MADIKKQDLCRARTPSDLERRYALNPKNAEAFGIANDAKASAEAAERAVGALDTKLGQQEILRRLTNDGESKAIYQKEDGLLYLNAAYIDTLEKWEGLQLGSNFAPAGGNPDNSPKYKVSGDIVTITGCVSPVVQTETATPVIFASGIPAAYCPTTEQHFVCAGSGMNRWNCIVSVDGLIALCQYGTTEATAIPVGASLHFTVTYQV